MNRHIVKEKVLNTEKKKKNNLLQAKNHKILGSQKMMLNLIKSDTLDICNLPQNHDDLSNLCNTLEMGKMANYSMAQMKQCIVNLYESIKTGASACHQTGNMKKATGFSNKNMPALSVTRKATTRQPVL